MLVCLFNGGVCTSFRKPVSWLEHSRTLSSTPPPSKATCCLHFQLVDPMGAQVRFGPQVGSPGQELLPGASFLARQVQSPVRLSGCAPPSARDHSGSSSRWHLTRTCLAPEVIILPNQSHLPSSPSPPTVPGLL